MPYFDYHCRNCGKDFEALTYPREPVECAHCKCREVDKKPAVCASYRILGDNSASVTPKKHRTQGES